MGRTVLSPARQDSARSAREIAVAVLTRVEGGDAFSNLVLHHALLRAHLPAADAGFATELVLGTLRHQARIDWTLGDVVRHPVTDIPPSIRMILRTAVYQLLLLGVPAHAAVDEAVKLARRHGHPGTVKLVNAVLRRIAAQGERPLPDAGDPVARLAIEHSHPRWLVERWVARFGLSETVAFCLANNAPAPSFVRVNTLESAIDDVRAQLRSAGVEVTPTSLPEGLQVHGHVDERHRLATAGILTVQDLGAMLVTHALDPQPGEMVIDACAAPGGKTTHIAERLGHRGRVIACDVNARKLLGVGSRAAAMGIDILEAHHLDARDVGKTFAGQADRLLIDAPCTGLGTVRRRPEIKWRILPDDLGGMAARQQAILHGACGAVRPGGVLLYSVCTTEPEESEQVTNEFLGEHREFVLDPMPLPALLAPVQQVPGMATLLPHRHGTDGFFIARMRRWRIGTDSDG